MRKRDLAILMLCAFAIFFSLQHEGDFSFREAWFHLSDEYPIKYEAERLPPPLVADLNGDGKKEILVATHDAKIQAFCPILESWSYGVIPSLETTGLLSWFARLTNSLSRPYKAHHFLLRICKAHPAVADHDNHHSCLRTNSAYRARAQLGIPSWDILVLSDHSEESIYLIKFNISSDPGAGILDTFTNQERCIWDQA